MELPARYLQNAEKKPEKMRLWMIREGMQNYYNNMIGQKTHTYSFKVKTYKGGDSYKNMLINICTIGQLLTGHITESCDCLQY